MGMHDRRTWLGSYFKQQYKLGWLYMLEPPWRHSGPELQSLVHWLYWLQGWAWALAGLAGGALVAPSLVQIAGLSDSSYYDALVIGVAVIGGILVQALGWVFFILPQYIPVLVILVVARVKADKSWLATVQKGLAGEFGVRALFLIALSWIVRLILPVAGVGYGVYRYLALVGAGQRSVTVAFLGGLLVKTFLIPLIKAVATGWGLKQFLKWVRTSKPDEPVKPA